MKKENPDRDQPESLEAAKDALLVWREEPERCSRCVSELGVPGAVAVIDSDVMCWTCASIAIRPRKKGTKPSWPPSVRALF